MSLIRRGHPDDYDDHGNYRPGPGRGYRPRRATCEGCYCVATRACETWPGDNHPEGDTDD